MVRASRGRAQISRIQLAIRTRWLYLPGSCTYPSRPYMTALNLTRGNYDFYKFNACRFREGERQLFPESDRCARCARTIAIARNLLLDPRRGSKAGDDSGSPDFAASPWLPKVTISSQLSPRPSSRSGWQFELQTCRRRYASPPSETSFNLDTLTSYGHTNDLRNLMLSVFAFE